MPRPAPVRLRRTSFGRDPAGFDRARLDYPERLWRTLARRCGLGPGVEVFEIGPGSGKATRRLLAAGAGPITLVEADPRFVRHLRRHLRTGAVPVRYVPRRFESARLPSNSFDLGVAATSFHWLPPKASYRKVARVLRPGGWFASFLNHYGDPFRPSRFQRALQPLYREVYGDPGGVVETRGRFLRELRTWYRLVHELGEFDRYESVDYHWSVTLPTRRVVRIWSTFSEVATLPPARRRRFLWELAHLSERGFGGRVTLHMMTPVRLVRKRWASPRRGPEAGPLRGRRAP